MKRLAPLCLIGVVLASAVPATRADIFQWEYINPADPSQGKRPSTVVALRKWKLTLLTTIAALLVTGHALAAEIVLRFAPGGAASLANSSLDTSVILMSYSITRRDRGVEFLPAGWDSLQFQGHSFLETSATADLLSEAAITDGLVFGPGQSRSIGVPFELRGDADGNGGIDLTDFAIWKQHQGEPLQGPGTGDFNLNGVVDADDYEILLNTMGNSAVYTFAATSAPTSTFDLAAGDAIVPSTAATKSADFAQLYGHVKLGYHGGDWQGTGITSSTAAADNTRSTTIAVVDNALLGLITFSRETVTADSILLKYTYYGDIDVNGQVDGEDLTVFALNFGQTTGMTQIDGDIDFDGDVDGEDLTVFANTFGKGVGNPLSAAPPQAIPEPRGLVLAGLAAAGVLAGVSIQRWRSRRVDCRMIQPRAHDAVSGAIS